MWQILNNQVFPCVKNWSKPFHNVPGLNWGLHNVSDFELKKNSNSEVLVTERCEMTIFAFKLLERVRIWKVFFLQRVIIWNKFLLNASFWMGKKEWSVCEMKNLEFSEILNSLSYNVSDFETKR